jgi:hypothetical protein
VNPIRGIIQKIWLISFNCQKVNAVMSIAATKPTANAFLRPVRWVK